uniref:B30.2/SPRY domain-containing protein n=1 Tax=Globodera rostochiensis TaxID=31243 RepID=A0A914H4A0_GLORO
MEEHQKEQQQNIDESTEMKQLMDYLQSDQNALGMDQLKGELIAKMEKYQKQQQQTIDELKEMKQLNMDYLQSDQNALLERQQQKTDQKALNAPIDQAMDQLKGEMNAKMEKYQKQQQQNIDELQKLFDALSGQEQKGLIPQQNRWEGLGDSLSKKGSVFIGLATNQMRLNERVGNYKGTFAYESNGTFWGHEVEGCSHAINGRPHIEGKPEFKKGDVIGCGVDLATSQIIYTKNGKRLKTTGLFVNSGVELFACVTMLHYGIKIEANFGPNFIFNIADGI